MSTMAQHASNVAGPSNSNTQVVIELDIRMPSHLSDFVTKSVKEFKKLRQDHAKSENYLARLSLQYEEGTIPHSLRMKPPKLQIGDPEAHSILDAGLAKCTSAYRIKCFEALLQAQKSYLTKLKTQLDGYKPKFEARLSSLTDPLLAINKPIVEKWHALLSASFHSQVDTFLIQCHISEAVKQAAISERETARETAMGEADNLPVETSIATLVRIEVQKEIKKALNSLNLKAKLASKVKKPAKTGKKSEIAKGKKPMVNGMEGTGSKKKKNTSKKGKGSGNEERRNGNTSTRSNPSPSSSRRPTNRNPKIKFGSGTRKPSLIAKGGASKNQGKNAKTKMKKPPAKTAKTARGGSFGTR